MTNQTTPSKDETLAAEFTIEPNEMHKAELGRYREKDPEPTFHIYYGPHEPHVVTHHKSKLSDGEIYILFIRFQNFGDKPCSITIRRVAPDLRLQPPFVA